MSQSTTIGYIVVLGLPQLSCLREVLLPLFQLLLSQSSFNVMDERYSHPIWDGPQGLSCAVC